MIAKMGLSTVKSAFSGVQKTLKTQVKSLASTKISTSNTVTDVIVKESAETKTLFKQKFIRNSKSLSFYDNACKELDFAYPNTNVLYEIDNSRLKEFEKICAEILKKSTDCRSSRILTQYQVKVLTDLYYHDPEAYKYVMNSGKPFGIFSDFRNYLHVRYLSKPLLQECERGYTTPALWEYVQNSDRIYRNPEMIKEVHEAIARRKITAPITVCRGERHTGIFSEIPLTDKVLVAEIKLMNRLKYKRTKQMTYSEYKTIYFTFGDDGKVYDYIKNKKNLSLADAMLVMQILSKKSQTKVLNMIKGVNLCDTRFKSTSPSEFFVDSWIRSGLNRPATIKNRMTLHEGTEALYFAAANGQPEFIVNNTPKNIRFTNAQYDPKKNCFILDSDVSMSS